MVVAVHVAAGVLALLTGDAQTVLRKGTPRHRVVGRGYVVAMAVLLVSSFGIYELRAGPSVFHAVTVLAAALVFTGLLAARRAPSTGARRWHLRLMLASYLVLVVTFVAQFFDRLPLPNPALNAVVFLQLPLIAGLVGIVRAERRHLPTR